MLCSALGTQYALISSIVLKALFLFFFFWRGGGGGGGGGVRRGLFSSLAPIAVIGCLWTSRWVGVLDPQKSIFLNLLRSTKLQ
jgi:hypothetical protein